LKKVTSPTGTKCYYVGKFESEEKFKQATKGR